MEQSTEYTGDMSELNQDEEYPTLPIPAVRVNVDGPVQTHAVPSVSGGSRSFALAATDQPKRVGNEDPRRRVLRLLADQAFFAGEDANQVQSRYAARWPANVVLEITHMETVYVSIVVDGTISVMSENWAS